MQKQQTIIKNNRSKICFSVINKDGSFKNLGQRSINIISYADLVQGLQEKYEIHSEETDLTDVDLKFEDGYIIYSDKEIRNKEIKIIQKVKDIWNDDKTK